MTRRYGGDETWHDNGELDVETDVLGNVVAVWFRCQPLPFRQARQFGGRVKEMRSLYREGSIPSIVAVELNDDTNLHQQLL